MFYIFRVLLYTTFIALFSYSCTLSQPETPERNTSIIDDTKLLDDLRYLSSDELEGRRTGTQGNKLAQQFIEEQFQEYDLKMVGDSYRHLFTHTNRRSGEVFNDAINLFGYIEGSEHPDRFLVISAHYDHLGVEGDDIYNGADDNASGTAGLLSAIRYFTEFQPKNSILFIAFDAEEQGLAGARHFVENPEIPLEQLVLNINMDMISNNFDDELYAVGTAHYPYLKPMIEETTIDSEIKVLFGYDTDEWPQNWTFSSDHGPFHQNDVPFIYFGVEDHAHYHKPSDTYENTNPDFFVKAVETILYVIDYFDNHLDEVVSNK